MNDKYKWEDTKGKLVCGKCGVPTGRTMPFMMRYGRADQVLWNSIKHGCCGGVEVLMWGIN